MSDLVLGDVEAPTLAVSPYDGTTDTTLTVTAPDGTETTPATTAEDDTPEAGTQTWTAGLVTYDQAGRWVLHWTITGTGAGAEYQQVYVVASPTAGGPTWTPGRSRVANYVPGRTLARDAETHELTFNSKTLPNGVQVDQLIADAVAQIRARTGDVDASLHDAASVVASKLAACAVERGYPAEQEEQSLRRARDICDEADRMLDDLVESNKRPDDPGGAQLPLYSFPSAVTWGDENFI